MTDVPILAVKHGPLLTGEDASGSEPSPALPSDGTGVSDEMVAARIDGDHAELQLRAAERAPDFFALMSEQAEPLDGTSSSTMRPLRCSGPTPDVLWDEGVILVRRSHTLGDTFMNTTKTNLRQRITVPSEVMEVLRWHVATQLVTPEQKASELLFPAEDGRFRSVSFLKKAFATVGELTGLTKTFTPRGMRRTFNDLARVANVEAIVTKSISGHKTERMREHYSTVSPGEQRESIGHILRLVHSARRMLQRPRPTMAVCIAVCNGVRAVCSSVGGYANRSDLL